ncbi:MAG TPA: hypothetical protein VGK32_15820 [Vicinamibacterales bacterium]|jgi:hypothetical protein
MTARAVVALASLAAALSVGACGTSSYEVAIETPITPKLDVSPFQRVLVAGFVAGGSDDVDANMETVRLLRSQLRTKSNMKVIEADVIPLTEVAAEQKPAEGDGTGAGAPDPAKASTLPKQIKDEKDLEAYDTVFANANYWKKLGEEFQSPLIVTGTVLFTPHARSGYVQREREQIDAYGRRTVEPVRAYMERKGYILRPRFVFIDGRTGATLYSETFREEVLYNPQQDTPALSSFFELMDRLIPGFLGTLSSQKIRGTRTLLK